MIGARCGRSLLLARGSERAASPAEDGGVATAPGTSPRLADLLVRAGAERTRQPATIVPATLSTITISAKWTAPIRNKAIAPRGDLPACGCAANRSTGTDSSSISAPPSTANSGVSASMTARLEPARRTGRGCHGTAPQTTNTGPSASSDRQRDSRRRPARRPCRAAAAGAEPQQVGGEKRRCRVRLAGRGRLGCRPPAASAAKTMSIRSANSWVAEPLAPIRMPAIWSGAPTARFQTTLVGDPAGGEGQHQAERHHPRGQRRMPRRLRPVISENAKNAT